MLITDKIYQLFGAILNLGIDESTSIDDAKRVRIVNGISFLGGIVLIIISLVLFVLLAPSPKIDLSLTHDLLFGNEESKPIALVNLWIIFPIIDVLLGVICFLILLLNAKKYWKIAANTLCIVATLYTSFFFLVGGVRVVFLFFIPAILPILFFNKKASYLSFGLANFIILFTISLILYKNNSLLHLPSHNYLPTFIINIIFAFTIIFLIVVHFKNQITKNEKILTEQNRRLQQMTQEISSQRDELKANNNKLKVMNATKDKFFSIIAHDLRNPFNGILGFSDLLVKSLANNRIKDSVGYANIIYTSARNAFTLLENLLEWSRSQTGRITYHPQIVDFVRIVEKSVNVCKDFADGKGIELQISITENLSILADENMLNSVMRNLITNAIKYTPKGGRVTITAQASESLVEVAVTDTGIGMSSETMNKLFKIHEIDSKEGTEKEAGTGLGLLLCKTFIEKHGGKINVESELGKGSCFRFTIPQSQNYLGSA